MTALIVCLIGWILIGGVVAFISVFADERPPLSVDTSVWVAGVIFMILIHTHGG